MDIDAALEMVRDLVITQSSKPLSDVQSAILRGALLGKTFAEIAEECPCNESYAKEVSSQLCKLLSAAVGVPVGKRNLRSALERRLKQRDETQELLVAQEKKAKSIAAQDALNNSSRSEQVSVPQAEIDPVFVDSDSVDAEGPIAHPSIPNQNFVGRDKAIASLNTHINQGAKIIVIQANGGVGKTTLAHEYLNSQGFDLVLDLPMAKEKDNIQLVDSVIEGWLKQDFDEEPGREFWEMLRRLKRQLQTRKIGVLIDNLEPALDGQGRFIEPHRRYVELLRVLADPTVQSVTLITSRVRLCEPDVNVAHYLLPGLDEQAWQQFFMSRHINIDILTLNAMHKAYGGNAKAMGILCGAILEDFDGDMVAYWRNNNGDLLVKADLENLVTSQFQRLQELNSEAYQLLCRLGCYRYQDVPTVPTEGLLCLLWDVPEGQRRRVIESLRNRSLVEFNNGEYWLHPMIRAEAIARLRASENWAEANRKAAEFWTEGVKTVETIQDAMKAFEAYYQYVTISKFEWAGEVLIKERKNKWSEWKTGEYFARSLYKLGILQSTIKAISLIIHELKPSYNLSLIYNTLGNLYWLTGDIQQALQSHQEALVLADEIIKFNNVVAHEIMLEKIKFYSVFNIGCCYLYLGETKEAVEILEQVRLTAGKTNHKRLAIQASCCLAFLYSEMGFKQKALQLALPIYNEVITPEWGAWSAGNSLFFLGLTYKNTTEYETSKLMYERAIFLAKNSFFIVIEAKALYGLSSRT
ncbi:tetratricopeptide repeat protein [Microcoleus sp. CAWBG640]|uniref:tetratricopeptide repeat protein n=1 Tax=Microcoleus sp. CAWBG640 TaxID=2841653 RepID=UPI00312B845D